MNIVDCARFWNEIAWEFSPLINCILTLFLVGITAIYAYLTRAMWAEMQLSRESSILPIVDLEIISFSLVKESRLDDRLTFNIDIEVKNLGRGPAYDLHVTTYGGKFDESKNRAWAHWINTGFHSLALEPGKSDKSHISIYTKNDPNDYNHPDVVSFNLRYRNSVGTRFSINKWYSQNVIEGDDGTTLSRWLISVPSYEGHFGESYRFLSSFRRKKSTGISRARRFSN